MGSRVKVEVRKDKRVKNFFCPYVVYFNDCEINPQAHGYRRSFHREYSRVSYPQGTCVH